MRDEGHCIVLEECLVSLVSNKDTQRMIGSEPLVVVAGVGPAQAAQDTLASRVASMSAVRGACGQCRELVSLPEPCLEGRPRNHLNLFLVLPLGYSLFQSVCLSVVPSDPQVERERG